MKPTGLLTKVIVTLLLFAICLGVLPAAAVPITKMSVIPKQNSWTEPTKTIGSSFTVNINISNAASLRAWQVGITWDTNILDFVSYTWGDFRNYAGVTLQIPPTINETSGRWTAPASETWATGGVEGGVTAPTVTLLTLTFKFTAYGISPMAMIDAIVVDWEDAAYTPPAFTLEQGTAELLPPPTVTFAFIVSGQTYTIAIQTNTSISTPTLNEEQRTISFNATGTSAGYANVTIPESFMKGPWIVQVENSEPLTLDIRSNGTHTFIYLTFNLSLRTIEITASWMIPEFPTTLIQQTLLILIVTSIAILISRRAKSKPHAI